MCVCGLQGADTTGAEEDEELDLEAELGAADDGGDADDLADDEIDAWGADE